MIVRRWVVGLEHFVVPGISFGMLGKVEKK